MPFWKFWRKGGASPVQTVPWEATKVRSYKFIEAPGGRVFRDMYLLRLLWEDPAQPHKLKYWMNIGYKGWWEDERLFRLWEHIRRYMEEDGPPIQPGETLRTTRYGKLPKFPAEVIAAAGGPAFSVEAVAALATPGAASFEDVGR
ncbi:hypothetical protein ASG87_02765 [Frateuria sp. Soil773]|nr:hypothetical protein ASG87_02765 [Frateuria sp. Soil773]